MAAKPVRRKIVKVKPSRILHRLLVLLDCGHVRTMPTCSDGKKIAAGKLMRCRDCEPQPEDGMGL